jgi:hypothetical protein
MLILSSQYAMPAQDSLVLKIKNGEATTEEKGIFFSEATFIL